MPPALNAPEVRTPRARCRQEHRAPPNLSEKNKMTRLGRLRGTPQVTQHGLVTPRVRNTPPTRLVLARPCIQQQRRKEQSEKHILIWIRLRSVSTHPVRYEKYKYIRHLRISSTDTSRYGAM